MQINSPAAVNQNALVLGMAAALANAIISEVGSKSLSKSVNGETLTRDRAELLVAVKLSSAVQKQVKGN